MDADFRRKVAVSHWSVVLLAVALVVASCLPMSAQVLKGSISGTVMDQQGAVISGAKVTAKNVETGGEFNTTSESNGLFRMNLLPVGTYNLEITAQGFQTVSMRQQPVIAGKDTSLGGIKMTVGAAATTVEVTAEAPLITTTQAQITNNFSSSTISSWAGLQENQGLDQMAQFVPGVAPARSNNFSNTNGGGFSSNGLRGRNNDQEIDGQNNNDNSVGGPGLFVSNPNFVQEYVLVTNNFGAEYGRNAGSVVNIITKSGTNSWHGSIYGDENNSVLNAMSNTQKRFTFLPGTSTNIKQPPRSNDEFTGFTIGGPMIRDKMFFFGGFDNEIFSGNTIYTTASLTPTPAGLATLAACFPVGNPANAVAALAKFGPYGISAGNPSPISVSTTAVTVAGCPNVQFGGVTRTLPTHFHGFDWIARWDYTFNSSNQFSARYIFNKGTNFNSNSSGTTIAAMGYPNDVPAISQTILASWTHNFSSRMVNEARISYGRLNVVFGGNSFGSVPKDTQIAQAVAQVRFNSSAFGGFGPASNIPQGRIVNTWQLQDNWNYVLGKHQLKAGVNFTYQRSPNVFLPALNGTYRFSNWSAYFANTPNRDQVAQGPSGLDFREYDTFLYFQDDWRVTQNLTLNLGLTWSYYGQPANLFNDITTKRETNPATAFWNPALPLSVRTFPRTDAYMHAFGPSVGFAYTPQWGGFLTGHGKTVIRGGYRLSYDPAFYNIYINISSSSPEVFLQSITAAPPAMPAVPLGPNVRASLAAFITPGVFDPRTQAETTIPSNFGPDRVGQWSLGVQRQLTTNSVLEVRYVGNHADRQFQTINANPRVTNLLATFPSLVPAGVTPCAATQQIGPGAGTDIGRVNCGFGALRSRTNTGYSNYEGLQVEFRATNLFKQLSIRSGFTWSKTLDNVSEIFQTQNAGNTNAISQNVFNFTNQEYGISGLNYPHRFTVQFDEQLPFFKEQHGVAGHIFGGWAFNGTYILASGQPYTPITFQMASAFAATNYYDTTFWGSFFSNEPSRPFLGNPNAPATSVGVFCADAFLLAATFFGGSSACPLAPTQLVSVNALGASCLNVNNTVPVACNFVPVTANDVRFIINAREAQTVFGTPFGNVGRNTQQDAISNIGNFSVYKRVKLNERTTFEFHMTMTNVFNHYNFLDIDPFLEDAGQNANFTGFGDPAVTRATGRRIWFGGKITF